jgi:uncharacterized protein YdeI (YjbR/CyaY-like superfamily)
VGVADFPEVHPKTRAAWRAWLAKNHAKSTGIWLVFFKQATGKRRLSYADAVEEALCFGWIDSVIHPIDETRYKQVFTPRKPRSNWSRLNKTRVDRMIAAKLRTPAGLAKIDAAKKNGSWTALDHVEDLVIPPELEKAFAKNRKARARFEASSYSARKYSLYWINNVKTPARRESRVAALIELLDAGLPLNPGNRNALLAGEALSTRERR